MATRTHIEKIEFAIFFFDYHFPIFLMTKVKHKPFSYDEVDPQCQVEQLVHFTFVSYMFISEELFIIIF